MFKIMIKIHCLNLIKFELKNIVCRCAYLPLDAEGRKLQLSSCTLLCFLKLGFSMNLDIMFLVRLTSPTSAIFLSMLELQSFEGQQLSLFPEFLVRKSGLHAYKASALNYWIISPVRIFGPENKLLQTSNSKM